MGIYVAFAFSILSACSQSNSSNDIAYEIPKFDRDGSIEIQTKQTVFFSVQRVFRRQILFWKWMLVPVDL